MSKERTKKMCRAKGNLAHKLKLQSIKNHERILKLINSSIEDKFQSTPHKKTLVCINIKSKSCIFLSYEYG